MGRAGDAVGDPVEDVKLLDCDLVDLVEDINAGDIESVSFDDIDELIDSGVASEADISVRDLVLTEHSLDGILVDVCQIDGLGDADTALFFLLEGDVGGLLVEPDSEPFKLLLNELLVGDGLERVEHDEDEVAGTGHSDNLLTTTLTVLGTLDDTGEIEELDTGALVVDDAGHAGEGCELVCGDGRVCVGELVQQGGLADTREAHETDTGVTGLCNVETFAGTTSGALAAGGDELTTELGELGLENTKMEGGCLVALCARHLVLDILDLLKNGHCVSLSICCCCW